MLTILCAVSLLALFCFLLKLSVHFWVTSLMCIIFLLQDTVSMSSPAFLLSLFVSTHPTAFKTFPFFLAFCCWSKQNKTSWQLVKLYHEAQFVNWNICISLVTHSEVSLFSVWLQDGGTRGRRCAIEADLKMKKWTVRQYCPTVEDMILQDWT